MWCRGWDTDTIILSLIIISRVHNKAYVCALAEESFSLAAETIACQMELIPQSLSSEAHLTLQFLDAHLYGMHILISFKVHAHSLSMGL